MYKHHGHRMSDGGAHTILFPWGFLNLNGKVNLMVYFKGPAWGKVLFLQLLGHFITQPSSVIFSKDCLIAADCSLTQGVAFSEYSIQRLMEVWLWCIPHSVLVYFYSISSLILLKLPNLALVARKKSSWWESTSILLLHYRVTPHKQFQNNLLTLPD